MSNIAMEKGKSKFAFEFTIPRQAEKKVKGEDGVEKVVKFTEEVPAAFLRPSRKLYEIAEIFYSARVSEFLSQGLMPASLVAKRYIADGGPLSEEEKKSIEEINEQIEILEKEYGALVAEEVIKKAPNKPEPTAKEVVAADEKKSRILSRLAKHRDILNQYENTYESIYDNSAESKARARTLTWWSTQLAFISDTLQPEYRSLFGEGDFQARMEEYDKIYESDNVFMVEATKIFAYLCSVFFAAKGNIPADEFKNVYRLYWSISDYKIIDDEKEAAAIKKQKEEEEAAELALIQPFPEPKTA